MKKKNKLLEKRFWFFLSFLILFHISFLFYKVSLYWKGSDFVPYFMGGLILRYKGGGIFLI